MTNLDLYKYRIKLRKSLSLRTLLIVLIFLYIVAILIGSLSLLLDSNPLFDELTLLLSLGIGLLLLFAVKFSRKYLFDQIAIITFFFLIFILPRIITYLFAPAVVIWPFGYGIDASTINAGLLYVLIGTMFFIIGIAIADIVFRPSLPLSSAASGDPSCYSTRALITLFLVVVAIQLYASIIMEISPYGKMRAESYNTLFQLIKTSLELDSAFFFVFATLLFRSKIVNKSEWGAVILVLLCYIFVTALCGSRAGVLRVVTALMIIPIVIQGNFRLKLGKFLTAILLLGGLSLAIFPFATMNRLAITASHRDNPYAYEYAIAESKDLKMYGKLSARVLNRLAVLDYPILIVTQEGDPEAKEKYINLLYPTKNIINMLMPGNPFPDAKIMTSRVVDVIYRGASEPPMYSRYFSEHWTLWGLAYVLFGWLGGLFAILFIGFIIHSLYALIIMLFSGTYQFYLRLWLLLYVTQGIIGNMGVDSAFTTIFFGLLQFTVLYFCLFLINFVHRSFGSLLKQTVEV